MNQVRSGRNVSRRLAAAMGMAICAAALLQAQIPSRNVNMVSGRTLPDGDPFLQRQNEPSVAASTRNPLHLLAGANDYRTVDLPGLPDSNETGDAWMGVFKSYDGGNTWRSTLIPGYPQDAGSTSPLRAYKAAADPVVRAGTNGLFYYSGIVFDRATPAKSAMFVSRFIDNNNQEAGDPIVFLDTKLIATNDGTAFIDKPWFAVDIPRGNAQICTITTSQRSPTAEEPDRVITTTQSFPGGAAYAVFSLITGEGTDVRSQLYLSRSYDCGATWSTPQQISSPLDPINQGATIAIDPRNGTVYIAWRRFTADGTDDSIMVTRSVDQGRRWDPPGRARRFPRGKKVGLTQQIHGKNFKRPIELSDLTSLDQPTRSYQFRTNAYPTMTVSGDGRVYVAWSERGFAPAPQNDPDYGDARILIASSTDGTAWTAPAPVDNLATFGHQVMPTLTTAGGKLMIAYYDFRQDVSGVFGEFIDERAATVKRHTVDVRAAMAEPAAIPAFEQSVKVSEYLWGSRQGSQMVEQLQFNPPNLKLFQLGNVPFMGDYIDIAPSPSFVPTGTGGWAYNNAPSSSPLFHVVWSDNRDVIPPPDGDWTNYAPPGALVGQTSYFDPEQTLTQGCLPSWTPGVPNNRAGMRNQNIYTARVTGGLVAGSPGNTKLLDPKLPRSFVVFAQNATEAAKTFRMTIENQPIGGTASFLQAQLFPDYAGTEPLLLSVDVVVPRRSTVVRTVYATSADPHAQIVVSVKEVSSGTVEPQGLQTTVILNPDISNPDISNPDISNPDISNPDISNPDISNAEVSNPDISNPDISNPDISNPDISNQSLTDTTWTVTNNGNTTSAYTINLLLSGTAPTPDKVVLQLILHRVYTTPVAVNCVLATQTQNVLLANITNPQFTAAADADDPDVSNPDISNATLWLAPGESAKITLRSFDKNISDAVTFNAAQQVTPAVVPHGVDVELVAGELVIHAPDVALPDPANLQILGAPATIVAGQPIGTINVRYADLNGGPIPGAVIALSIHTVPGGAQVGPTLNSVTSVDGSASFQVGPLLAGTYRLRAVSTALGYDTTTVWSANVVVTRDIAQWNVDSGGNGHYYEYVRQGGLSWPAANAAAASRTYNGLQGHLVTITSAAENQFVNSLRNGGDMRAWTGLYYGSDITSDGATFRWVTGEPVTYTNWSAGEPNNLQSEFWVEMFGDGTWNNNVQLDASFPTLGFIVEYSLPVPPSGVSGALTYNSVNTGIGTWTQNVAQSFVLTVDMTNQTTSLSIDGVAVNNAQDVPFVNAATTLGQVGVEFGTTGTQRFGWDDIVVRNEAGTATIFSADFTDDGIDLAPGNPDIGTWQLTAQNGSVLVRSAAGNLLNKPVEMAQFGGANSVNLLGHVDAPPTTGVWIIEWKSVMVDPGTGYATNFNFVPIVIRGNGGIIASIEYR